MGFFSKWTRQKRDYLIWSPKRNILELQKLVWRPGLAEDTFNKRAWELAHDLKTYVLKIGRKEYRVNLLDEERGIGLNIEPDEKILTLKTNSDLNGQLIDAVMITTAYQLNPSLKKVIIGFVVGLLLGLLFGAGMGG
jgi:hypothetical protein